MAVDQHMECETPTVSVVMSVYNGAHYLRASLDSVLCQQGVDFEFVVVDDGSTDETPLILREYAKQDARVRVSSQENTGLTVALIHGCAIARGEFIARQDADDISMPGRLARQVRLLRSDPRLVFVSSHADVIGPDGEWLLTHERPADSFEATERLLNGGEGPPGHGSVMVREAAYEAVGGYRREFYFAQDCDLWLRLAEVGRLGYVPLVLYRYRVTPHSISGNRSGKQSFAALVDRCRDCRMRGQSESELLQESGALLQNIDLRRGASEARTHYFIARVQLFRDLSAAERHLKAAVRLDPWQLRPWVCLLALPLIRVWRHLAQLGEGE